jgi:5-methylcytosine-specific restriction protein A
MRQRTRASALERGYTREWYRLASEFKSFNPYCVGCAAIGVMRVAEVVDHILPHRGDEVLMWNDANWQSACAWHHNAIKPLLERMWLAGKLRDVDLKLDSQAAIKLTRQRHRPAIGRDGFPIPGT